MRGAGRVDCIVCLNGPYWSASGEQVLAIHAYVG
jgi:hypothetical protein